MAPESLPGIPVQESNVKTVLLILATCGIYGIVLLMKNKDR